MTPEEKAHYNRMTKFVAAAGMFIRHRTNGSILIVKPTYKEKWDVPGGMMEGLESPAETCEREIREELGIERKPGALLVFEWRVMTNKGIPFNLYMFDGGLMDEDEVQRLTLQKEELSECRFVDPAELKDFVPESLVLRLEACILAHKEQRTIYLQQSAPYRG